MIISFRTRLFVIAGLIVGLVLSAVLLVGYKRVLAFEVGQLDERLCMEGRRLATQPFRPDTVDRLQSDVMSKLRISAPEQLMLKFEASPGTVRDSDSFQSAGWQDFLTLDAKQWQPVAERQRPDANNDRPERRDRPPSREDRQPPGPQGAERGSRQPPNELRCALASIDASQRQWRAARVTSNDGSSMLAVDLAAIKGELQDAFAKALQIVIPLALLLTALGAWLLSTLTMRPVIRLQQAMANITQKALDARMPARGEDREFVALIDAYNAMLARLEASFQQASRFSSDAAHELKTPLTILQGHIEQALGEATQPALQAKLMGLLDEIARLSDITRKLLLLSQADAGYMALQRVPIDLSRMLEEMADDAQMLLTTQRLECNISRRLVVSGDAVLLRQLFNNLISNAVRHGLPGGGIRLNARATEGGIEVEISNATQAIDAKNRAQFFDRFFRGDLAHSRTVEGSGLGLSLSREIALAHGGNLVMLPSAADVVSLRLTLPITTDE